MFNLLLKSFILSLYFLFQLSTDDELIRQDADSSEEEEVLPITDDEKEDSDEAGEEEDLPSRDYWGKKKSAYYDADFVDEDRGKTYRKKMQKKQHRNEKSFSYSKESVQLH
ncbi:hypothetical protein AVEN_22452-1 [Araneus ventricosus]|uniref:Uncharacterized protein n=1 Tax=Araneus ventricosus TaxID=182803 RepID=A0A4Y2X2P6_ARAVE|nr:hypothetical protein AVEN_22452-1 [Araneus ventricosus]